MERKKTTRTRLELFKAVFRGRQDRYMGDHTCIDKPITDYVLRDHLSGYGFKRVGIFPLAPDILDGRGTWWVVADIDNDNLDGAIRVKESLSGYGITSYIEGSKSVSHIRIGKGEGLHVWTFFREPVFAIAARNLMKHIAKTLGLVFDICPAVDAIDLDDEKSLGSHINLPFFYADLVGDRTVFLDPTRRYKPYRDQWKFLGSIREVDPELLYELCDTLGLEKGFPAAGDPHNEPAS